VIVKLEFDPLNCGDNLAAIFEDDTARTLYLLWRSGHVVSQHFPADVLRVAARIKSKQPQTVEELVKCFRNARRIHSSFMPGDARKFCLEALAYLRGDKVVTFQVAEVADTEERTMDDKGTIKLAHEVLDKAKIFRPDGTHPQLVERIEMLCKQLDEVTTCANELLKTASCEPMRIDEVMRLQLTNKQLTDGILVPKWAVRGAEIALLRKANAYYLAMKECVDTRISDLEDKIARLQAANKLQPTDSAPRSRI